MKPIGILACFGLALLATLVATGAKVAPTDGRSTNAHLNHNIQRLDLPGTINGAEDPGKIPDHVALSLVFRLIQKHRHDQKDQRLQGYLRLIGLNDADKEALLIAADEFDEQVGRLDEEAQAIKDKTWPSPTPSVMAQLTQLENQKNAIVTGIAARMLSRMSPSGTLRFQQHINGHVKSKIKMFPPTPLPSSLSHKDH